MEDRYLGDGVYASYDGYHVWLDLRAQDSTTRIAIEPAVWHNLVEYVADLSRIQDDEVPLGADVDKEPPDGAGVKR